jgi:hypothetical protein
MSQASTRNGLCSWFRLGEVDPNFKEFLTSPAVMPFGMKPDMGPMKFLPNHYFLRVFFEVNINYQIMRQQSMTWVPSS